MSKDPNNVATLAWIARDLSSAEQRIHALGDDAQLFEKTLLKQIKPLSDALNAEIKRRAQQC